MTSTTTEQPPVRPNRSAGAKRVAWIALAVFTAAFAVFETFQHGLWAGIAAPALFLAPGLTERAGNRVYNATHWAVIPVVLLLAYTFSPLTTAWMFNAALGWLTRIAVERAAGRGLRRRADGEV